MTDIAYVRRSIDAAFRLALRDQRAWSGFDLTAEGFFRSFMAVLIVMPLNILIDIFSTDVAIKKKLMEGGTVKSAYEFSDAVFSTMAMCAEWLIFPLVMIVVLRFVGLAHRYSALIIAHNWATVVIALVNIPVFALGSMGVFSPDLTYDVYFIVLGLTLYYRFYVAQTALDAGLGIAGSITLLDFLLKIYFALAVQATAGLWLPAAT
ncbi:MAG: hypothetical protein ABL996_14905 [Micropepsaceae bacterium]